MQEKRITSEMIELVPDLATWGDTPIDIIDWVRGAGSYELAIGYSRIFWPRLVELGDYVLLETNAHPETVRVWEEHLSNDKRAIEAMLNHVHMVDLQGHGAYNEAQMIDLGRTHREILQAKLAWQFPEKRFEVLFDETPGQAPEDYQVTFWQVRDER